MNEALIQLGKQAETYAEHHRQAARKVRDDPHDRGRTLGDAASLIEFHVGAASVAGTVATVIANSESSDAEIISRIVEHVINALTFTDDQWSGRGNDLKRSLHDGRCEGARTLQYSLRQAIESLDKP